MTALNPLDLFNIRSMLEEEEVIIQDSVARFVDQRVLPIIRECFEEHRFPRELVPEIAALGLLGSSLDGYGCAGLNSVAYGLICQELERGDSGIRSFVSVQSSLVMYPIYTFGSDEQKQRWLPAMVRGEAIGCFGLTEAHGGSDPGNLKTHARRQGGDWVLNGSKMWITNGTLADVAPRAGDCIDARDRLLAECADPTGEATLAIIRESNEEEFDRRLYDLRRGGDCYSHVLNMPLSGMYVKFYSNKT